MKTFTFKVTTDVDLPSTYIARIKSPDSSAALKKLRHLHSTLRTSEDKRNKIFKIKKIDIINIKNI